MSEVVLKVTIPFADDLSATLAKRSCRDVVEAALHDEFAEYTVELVEKNEE